MRQDMHLPLLLVELHRAVCRRVYHWLVGLGSAAAIHYSVLSRSACAGAFSPQTAATEAEELTRLVLQFKLRTDRCPRDLAELVSAGIAARERRDPWHHIYRMSCTDAGHRVCSAGPDGRVSADDICAEATEPPMAAVSGA